MDAGATPAAVKAFASTGIKLEHEDVGRVRVSGAANTTTGPVFQASPLDQPLTHHICCGSCLKHAEDKVSVRKSQCRTAPCVLQAFVSSLNSRVMQELTCGQQTVWSSEQRCF